MLERIRIIDMACTWSKNTHSSYQTQFNHIRDFQLRFGVEILKLDPPPRPPIKGIPLMWCMELNSTKFGRHPSRDMELANVSFGTVRALRSAVAQFYQVHAAVTSPSASMLNRERRLLYQPCRPTDGVAMQMFASGLAKRMGTSVKPSKALLERHVLGLDQDLDTRFLAPYSPAFKQSLALAGFANVCLWLTWMRSNELFSLTFNDITSFSPFQYVENDLPYNVGMLEFALLPETKSSPTRQADIIIADRTQSGLEPQLWLTRVIQCTQPSSPSDLIFRDDLGAKWTSKSFRSAFLHPFLKTFQDHGDTYLQGSITAAFWSLHCYRRGARTHVDKAVLERDHGAHNHRIEAMIYEHGRWRVSRSSLPMSEMYREWTPLQRLWLTLLFF